MVAIPSRHKSLFLLIGVVVLQVLFLAIQIRRDSQGRLIRVWTVGAVTPFQRAGSSGVGGIRGIWNHYLALQNASRDHASLTHQKDELKLQLNELQNKADEADALGKLLDFKQTHKSVPMLGARVIAASADSATQTIYLDRGEHDGIRRNMGVITPDGVVGKISETYPNTSQVLLLTDRDSGVGAMLVESHIQSPVGGAGEPLLAMKYVANDDTVAIGQHVVTSGMDRIFPRDLPVGTVSQIKDGNPFKQIRLKPAANLESLEDVIILLSVQPLDLTKSDGKDAKEAFSRAAAETKPAKGKPLAVAKKEPQSKSKTAKP